MDWLLTIPLVFRLTALFAVGCVIGSGINWAIYRWAWSPRDISPWSPPPPGCRQRSWHDRVPVIGWFAMRRESPAHGRGFWVRPLCIELGFAGVLAWLYWWEVDQLGLVRNQALLLGAAGSAPPSSVLHATFLSHAILTTLMAIATFIDIDEKTIPDRVTDPGTLLGLLLAVLLPMSMLPQITVRPLPPKIGQPLAGAQDAMVARPPGGQAYIEPATAAAPRDWPDQLAGAPQWKSLVVALACYCLWCFAIVPRIWRPSRGPLTAAGMILWRVGRELRRPPLSVIFFAGLVGTALTWWWGGPGWIGLSSALIGLVGGSALVWTVRIIGTAVLRREAMGFGDVTLMMMVGTFLGWQACVIAFFLAPFAGLLIGIAQLIFRRDDVIPYGPFLCLASLFVMVAWDSVWNMVKLPFAVGGLVPAVLVICMILLVVLLAIVQLLKKLFLGGRADA